MLSGLAVALVCVIAHMQGKFYDNSRILDCPESHELLIELLLHDFSPH